MSFLGKHGIYSSDLEKVIGLVAWFDAARCGYDQGVMGGLYTMKTFLEGFPNLNIDNPPANISPARASLIQGLMVGAYPLGSFFGALCLSLIGCSVHHKKTMMIASFFMLASIPFQATSVNAQWLAIFCLFMGFWNGVSTSTVTVWQSETVMTHGRGRWVVLAKTGHAFGNMLSFWVSFMCASYEPSSTSWKLPLGLQGVFILPFMLILPCLPESPRQLTQRGEPAIKTLCELRELPRDDPDIQAEMAAISKSFPGNGQGASFKDCFRLNKNRNLHRTLLALTVQILQQLSGISILTYYAPYILNKWLGYDPGDDSRTMAAVIAMLYGGGSFMGIIIEGDAERHGFMLFSVIVMSVLMIILAALASRDPESVALASVYTLYAMFFGIGWTGMPWLYSAEIVTNAVRARTHAFGAAANWLFAFLVVLATPAFFTKIGYGTYVIFALTNAIALFVCCFYPIIGNCSLEEIDEIFGDVKGLRGVVDVIDVAHARKPNTDYSDAPRRRRRLPRTGPRNARNLGPLDPN